MNASTLEPGAQAIPLAELLHNTAQKLEGAPEDFDRLIDRAGDAQFVLIGEASHGTHEFYKIRAEITKRLIREKGFVGVAVEGDWPDTYRVNRFVRCEGKDTDASMALEGFKRFPQWMWRNADVLDFVGWLRTHNEAVENLEWRVGFYGMDLYSLHASMEAVISYLRVADPEAARRAAIRYGCFDRFGDEPQSYGYATAIRLSDSCEKEVVNQLIELRKAADEYAHRDGRIAKDDYFYAAQNAKVVANAEQYYRAMFGSRASSWNLRDQHMVETLVAIENFLGRIWQRPKIVVWAHNSHLGDARATEMSARGEYNVGQMIREVLPRDSYLIGFSTYTGTVTAASDWGEPAERKTVRPGLPGSYEQLFHDTGLHNFALDLRPATDVAKELRHPLLQRAIGVIYRPETERQSHYFHASLPQQFDTILHYDVTRAVEPLEPSVKWTRDELPETYPSTL